MAARLANTMSNSFKGRPVQVSYYLWLSTMNLMLVFLIDASRRVESLKVKSHPNSLHFFNLWWSLRYSIYLTSNDVLKICDPKVDFSLSHADRNHNFKSAQIHSLKRQVVVSEFFF